MITVIADIAPKLFRPLKIKVPVLVDKVLALKKKAIVNVVFLNTIQAKKLNWQLRQKRYVPDVLSLNFSNYQDLGRKKTLPFLGELYICWPQVQKQAKANGKKAQQELAWVLLHGLLHLLGYDHEKKIEAKVMRELEQKILTNFTV